MVSDFLCCKSRKNALPLPLIFDGSTYSNLPKDQHHLTPLPHMTTSTCNIHPTSLLAETPDRFLGAYLVEISI